MIHKLFSVCGLDKGTIILYLKPEDSTLYYVANGSTEGKIKF